MSNPIDLPSRETLRAEREQVEMEIVLDRAMIARSRAIIAGDDKLFADSFDRLAESQKLIRRV